MNELLTTLDVILKHNQPHCAQVLENTRFFTQSLHLGASGLNTINGCC
jgi:hypothetical protein